MITGLILVGLIIDLGGAPNHERLGFQVQSFAFCVWSSPDCDYSTGRTLVSLLVLASSLTTLALIASSEFSLCWCKLHSHSREWNLLPCRCRIICQGKLTSHRWRLQRCVRNREPSPQHCQSCPPCLLSHLCFLCKLPPLCCATWCLLSVDPWYFHNRSYCTI